MNVLFGDVMTVYNYRKKEDGGQVWHRSVVRGVQWRHNRNELAEANKIQSENRVESITIDFERVYAKNPPYLSPEQYNQLPPGEKPVGWTLNKGCDILVQGECEMEILSEQDIRKLKQCHSYVAAVKAVSDNRGMPRLKHIKVVAE